LKSQEATGTACIGLEQNFIDTAVNEWRKRLLACVRIVGKHFKQFYFKQLKNGQLDKLSARVRNVNKMCFCALCYLNNRIALDKNVIFCWLCFPQVVQKQMLGEV